MLSEIPCTAWKVFVLGIFLVRIFPHLDWIPRDTDQKNSEYRHFSRSVEHSGNLMKSLFEPWNHCFNKEWTLAKSSYEICQVSVIFMKTDCIHKHFSTILCKIVILINFLKSTGKDLQRVSFQKIFIRNCKEFLFRNISFATALKMGPHCKCFRNEFY